MLKEKLNKIRTASGKPEEYLTEDEVKWVLETAPVVVIDNNDIKGRKRKNYSDEKLHIQVEGSTPLIDYLVGHRWVRVFGYGFNQKRFKKGEWYEYLGRLSVQLKHEKDAKERQKKSSGI